MIHLQQVSRKYGEKWVLREISRDFEEGSATAFVGHNGCGKSTLLRVLSGLVRPTRGTVRYDRPLVFHYVPDKFPVTHLTAEQYLLHMGLIDGVPRGLLGEEIRRLAGEFCMEEHLRGKMHTLSKGTLQKVGVIQALLVRPDVLLLDEPLSGQDRDAQKVFVEKVNRLRGQGVTLFMSCHEPGLVEALTERAYTISQGKLLPCPSGPERYRILLSWQGEEAGRQQAWKELAAALGQGSMAYEGGERTVCPQPEEPAALGREIIPYEDGVRLRLTQEECDIWLGHLLAGGWRLRGMYKDV